MQWRQTQPERGPDNDAKQHGTPQGAKGAQLQRAASGPVERAVPGFRVACSQGMVGDQPGQPGGSESAQGGS